MQKIFALYLFATIAFPPALHCQALEDSVRDKKLSRLIGFSTYCLLIICYMFGPYTKLISACVIKVITYSIPTAYHYAQFRHSKSSGFPTMCVLDHPHVMAHVTQGKTVKSVLIKKS